MARHAFDVAVSGACEPGSALGLTFAEVEHAGRTLTGVGDRAIQIVQ